MGWLSVLIPLVAAALLFHNGNMILGILAVVAVAGAFWSWRVMHNYASESVKHRPDYSGGFYDLTEGDAKAVPDWIAIVNMAFTVFGAILLIISFVQVKSIPWWGKWLLFITAYIILFISWGNVPTHRLDQQIPLMNPIGRPLLDTIILTGAPAVIAKLLHLPYEWLLIPITLISSLYATLAGRFIWKFKIIAVAVCLATSFFIWFIFYMT